MSLKPEDVLHFWFEELSTKQWFSRSDSTDALIRERFALLHARATACELYGWRTNAEGRLAEIIILDQFSRNLFRDDPRAFAQDAMALMLAQEAVALGLDLKLAPAQKAFLYLPYMHSESLVIHEEADRLYNQPGLEFNLDYERKHSAILKRFRRYPHRNSILGRTSTPEELAFLQEAGSSF
jgi:uncharacterized protein (DUF924 family)